MEIIQIVGLGIIASILAIIVKQQKAEFGVHIGIAAGIIIFLMIIGKMAGVLEVFRSIAEKANINFIYINIIMKIIAISYISEFGMQVCKDAGENAIASKIELAGKVLIMVAATPIITALLELITQILP